MNEVPAGGNLYLVGFRAAGKTSVGRLLAARLERRLVDMDRELATDFGGSIAELVAAEGWPGFRRRESSLLARLARQRELVVATGGGVVCEGRNIAAMRRSGWVVWLRAGQTTLRRRLAADPDTSAQRPPLAGEDPAAEVAALLRAREPLYQRAMHLAVDAERPVDEICRRILERLRERGLDL